MVLEQKKVNIKILLNSSDDKCVFRKKLAANKMDYITRMLSNTDNRNAHTNQSSWIKKPENIFMGNTFLQRKWKIQTKYVILIHSLIWYCCVHYWSEDEIMCHDWHQTILMMIWYKYQHATIVISSIQLYEITWFYTMPLIQSLKPTFTLCWLGMSVQILWSQYYPNNGTSATLWHAHSQCGQ